VISVRDRRISSLIAALLDSSGVSVTREDRGDPGDGDLWVTDPSVDAIERARSYLAHPGRRIVLVGSPEPAWADIPAVVIRDPLDFEALRARLADAVSSLSGATP
jgi:hypothetical protein